MESCQKDIQLKEEELDEGEWDFKGAEKPEEEDGEDRDWF